MLFVGLYCTWYASANSCNTVGETMHIIGKGNILYNPSLNSGILRDKIMDDKLMYNVHSQCNDDKKYYTFCGIKILVKTFEHCYSMYHKF